MKKDRNCGGNSPVYPTYPGMMPGVNPGMPQMGMPVPGVMPQTGMMPNQQMMNPNMVNPNMNYVPNYTTGNYGNMDELSRLKEQVQMLDRRVSRLENLASEPKNVPYNSSKFSDTNYHIM